MERHQDNMHTKKQMREGNIEAMAANIEARVAKKMPLLAKQNPTDQSTMEFTSGFQSIL